MQSSMKNTTADLSSNIKKDNNPLNQKKKENKLIIDITHILKYLQFK